MLFKSEPIYLTKQDLQYFSGGDMNAIDFPKNNIHTNLEFAQKCGLDGLAASGAMLEGIIADFICKLEGERWLTYGKMKIKFIEIVTDGDTITCYLSTNQYGYDVWCSNQSGVKVCVGQAIR